jgi:hypothetical protein
MKISNNRAIITGLYNEFFRYQNPYSFAWKRRSRNESIETQKETEKQEKKEKYAINATYRAKAKIVRLIKGNQFTYPEKPVFLTLTFKDNLQDLKQANKLFSQFVKRMSRRIKKQMRYVAVHEFQKRGAVHYHIVVFNLPYLQKEEIAKIWRHGFIRVNLIHVNGLANYMTKYMSKSFTDIRCKGLKRYFYSLENHIVEHRDNARCMYQLSKMSPAHLLSEPRTYTFVDISTGKTNSVLKTEYYVGGLPPTSDGGQHPT